MIKPLLPGSDADLAELEQFAAVRLVVADLDGTLFPSELAGTAQQLVAKLQRLHVNFTLATGRTYSGVQPALRGLVTSKGDKLIRRDIPLILYNGAIIVEAGTGQILQRKTISDTVLTEVLQIASNYPSEVLAYLCSNTALNQSNGEFLQERVLGWQTSLDTVTKPLKEFNDINVEWQDDHNFESDGKLCAILIKSPDPISFSELACKLNDVKGISLTRSGSIYIELRPFGSDKSVALEWVAQRLKLTPNQVLAVGDNDNDIEMLEWAGIGVVVDTASDSAKSHANYICHFGPFLGVIQIFRLLCSSHRYFKQNRAIIV